LGIVGTDANFFLHQPGMANFSSARKFALDSATAVDRRPKAHCRFELASLRENIFFAQRKI
jgi:hypothetical protein